MLINELSKRTGLTAHTIRFYEKLGLIKGKRDQTVTSNNYYHYDEVIVEKLELIRDAKSVGISLKEIGALLEAWYTKKISSKQKLQIIDNKLADLDAKIMGLKEMKKHLASFKKDVIAGNC
jgi:MerR family transcriptional regulator, copper efflux regulator